jgi:hypothetical protein
MDALLEQLVTKLELAFSGRLVAVVLYGSAAAPGQSDRLSDLNILCVLKQITPRELAEAEPVLHWWQQQGQPDPLLMSEEEVANSADCFPIEFRDMQRARRVLYGPDPIEDLDIHDTDYRAQVEHELRANLLRLRQQGAALLSDPVALVRLCAESESTFAVLGRHALLLAGIEPAHDRHELVRQLAVTLDADLSVFHTLLALRAGQAPPQLDAVELFAQYLVSIQAIVAFVDRLKRR